MKYMTNKNDWRLTNQMDYLFGKKLLHIHYEPYKAGWEHDHCEFCQAEIDGSIPLAYCTDDKYHWICESCYNDFKDMFRWAVL